MWSTIVSVITLVKFGFAFIRHTIQNGLIRFCPAFERPIVKVRQGRVQGVTAKLPNGGRYHFFKGIPYAKPPVGELRFQSPVPLDRFSKPVLDCSSDKGDIIQNHILFDWPVVGSEDGLYLNVYTPTLPVEASTLLPVMVYLHGGGLRHGTASAYMYDPKHMVQEDVIVVTVFYRLGPMGFLCLPNTGISGNAGLKDQRCALQWVHENIDQFGGDKANVTLFGCSAGSWSTYLHYLSPNSRQYFHRVICQSGDACTESLFQVDPEDKARRLAKHLGCTGETDQDLLAALMKASARSIVKHQQVVISEQEQGCPQQFLFRPVIERDLTDDSIITQTPEEILKSFDSLRIPIMTGCTNAEGMLALRMNQHRFDEFNKHPDWFVPRFLGHPKGLDRTLVGGQVKKFYLGNNDFGRETANESCALMSDFTFIATSNLGAEWIAKYQPNVRHYHYTFTYRGRLSMTEKLFNVGPVEGACHSDDMWYMFSPSFLPNLQEDSEEFQIRDVYIRLLTNFAKYSNPTPDTSTLGFKWNPVNPVERSSTTFDLDCLEVNQTPRMIRNPCQERKDFVRTLITSYTNLL